MASSSRKKLSTIGKGVKRGGLMVKLDFEKAYDSVDHKFLDNMLCDMDFGRKWREWIRNCISSPGLSVLVNGSPTFDFGMERGFRQGDPLSPFLFNVVVEGLSAIFKKAECLGMMKGVSFGEEDISVTHLQFADDTMLFLQPKEEYLVNARRILSCFKVASGLKINFSKSCVVKIGLGGSREVNWAALFRCASGTLPITYLGLPLGGRPCSKLFWNDLVCRMENWMDPWKKLFLNKGGRLVLIKAVMASIPIYFMSIFKVPVGVASRIEKLQRSFFWGDGQEKRKIHMINWDSLRKSKERGGLGIGSILDKNKGLLAKWLWRFGKEVLLLWKRVICAKYRVPLKSLCWDWNGGASSSYFVKAVGSVLE
ncbi:hypothetical protein LWI29_032852 [Acer saccharum]|uniref:Reverse transcriptase domain-containing protein n=1 Tax=Acer saccharum TaxID=4024 RepID=A0AA39S654_ACESA|nr:hypothetical protein LWI29_032852 [Acer saccharum]